MKELSPASGWLSSATPEPPSSIISEILLVSVLPPEPAVGAFPTLPLSDRLGWSKPYASTSQEPH
jgi:hypothetical protein